MRAFNPADNVGIGRRIKMVFLITVEIYFDWFFHIFFSMVS